MVAAERIKNVDLLCRVDLHHGKLGRQGNISKTFQARRGSQSLKTTIPAWVKNCLGLERNNELTWIIIFNENKPNAVLVYKRDATNK